MSASTNRVPAGLGQEVAIRCAILPDRPCVVLSSGYGIFGFDEPVQLSLIGTLEEMGIGWAQYSYIERNARHETTDLLISSGLSALRATCAWTRARTTGPLALFGISFGANVSLEAGLLERPGILLLVNPVFDYVDYRSKQLGEEAMQSWLATGAVSIDYGMPVRSYHRFIEEARAQDLMNRVRNLACRVLACQAENDPILGTGYLERFAVTCPHAATHIIPDADHGFTDPDAIRRFTRLAEVTLHEWAR